MNTIQFERILFFFEKVKERPFDFYCTINFKDGKWFFGDYASMKVQYLFILGEESIEICDGYGTFIVIEDKQRIIDLLNDIRLIIPEERLDSITSNDNLESNDIGVLI